MFALVFGFFSILLILFLSKRHWEFVITLLAVIKGLFINGLFHQQGKLPNDWKVNEEGGVAISDGVKKILSKSEVEWRVDAANYDRYRSLCGYKSHDTTDQSAVSDPPCYPETAFIVPTISIVSLREFPLSPLALIHISQTIKMYRPLCLESLPSFQLECGLSELRVVPKGIEIDFLSKVYRKEELVWESSMTLLSRNKSTRHRNKTGGTAKATQDINVQDSEGECLSFFDVPEGIGWEYAKVSSDYNPHHLNGFTAKLVGYPKPMIHGLWTLSRVMSILTSKVASTPNHNPYPLVISAQFKRPLFIPSPAVLKYQIIEPSVDDSSLYHFKLNQSKTFSYRVMSGGMASPSTDSKAMTSVNMIGYVTFKADV